MVETEPKSATKYLPGTLLFLGVALIAVSLAPMTALSRRAWTVEDSQHFSEVTRELHQSTLDLPKQPGRTDEELAHYQENLEQEFERLNSKLEQAQTEPARWSRRLWWSGAALAATGAAMHVSKRG